MANLNGSHTVIHVTYCSPGGQRNGENYNKCRRKPLKFRAQKGCRTFTSTKTGHWTTCPSKNGCRRDNRQFFDRARKTAASAKLTLSLQLQTRWKSDVDRRVWERVAAKSPRFDHCRCHFLNSPDISPNRKLGGLGFPGEAPCRLRRASVADLGVNN